MTATQMKKTLKRQVLRLKRKMHKPPRTKTGNVRLAEEKDPGFLKIGDGEIHLKTNQKTFRTVALVSFLYSGIGLWSSNNLENRAEPLSQNDMDKAEMCYDAPNQCSKADWMQIAVNEKQQALNAEATGTAKAWEKEALFTGVIGMSALFASFVWTGGGPKKTGQGHIPTGQGHNKRLKNKRLKNKKTTVMRAEGIAGKSLAKARNRQYVRQANKQKSPFRQWCEETESKHASKLYKTPKR